MRLKRLTTFVSYVLVFVKSVRAHSAIYEGCLLTHLYDCYVASYCQFLLFLSFFPVFITLMSLLFTIHNSHSIAQTILCTKIGSAAFNVIVFAQIDLNAFDFHSTSFVWISYFFFNLIIAWISIKCYDLIPTPIDRPTST